MLKSGGAVVVGRPVSTVGLFLHGSSSDPQRFLRTRRPGRTAVRTLSSNGNGNGVVQKFNNGKMENSHINYGADESLAAGPVCNEHDPCEYPPGTLTDFLHDAGIWKSSSLMRQKLMAEDPGLNLTLVSDGTSVSMLFNQDTWDRHRRVSRYWSHVWTVLNSNILKRLFQPLTWLTALTVAVCCYNQYTPSGWTKLVLSLTPHTLLGACLSLLLVFRTNASYSRFTDARAQWGMLYRCTRDWCRLSALYFPSTLRSKGARYVQVLAWVLKAHLRSGKTTVPRGDPESLCDDPSAAVKSLLNCKEADEVLSASNKPYFTLCKMTQLLGDAMYALPEFAKYRLDRTISEMVNVVGSCERILSTPIPVSYTRHTSRSLILWLVTLPMALYPHVGWMTIPSMAVISFIFLGIDEIGVEIEEPFAILPLLPLCNKITEVVELAMTKIVPMKQPKASAFEMTMAGAV